MTSRAEEEDLAGSNSGIIDSAPESISESIKVIDLGSSVTPEASKTLRIDGQANLTKGIRKPTKLTWQDIRSRVLVGKETVRVSLTQAFKNGMLQGLPLPELVDPSSSFPTPKVAGGEVEIRKAVARCQLCGISAFVGGSIEQRAHFKSHWHLVNLALVDRGRNPVSEEEAAQVMIDSSEEDDGEEEDLGETTSEEEENDVEGGSSSSAASQKATLTADSPEKSPSTSKHQLMGHGIPSKDKQADPSFVTVQGRRTVLILEGESSKSGQVNEEEWMVSALSSVCRDEFELRNLLNPSEQKHFNWAVLLYQSGHFAAAIYREGKLCEHRTEHRYTQRRKQGGSQAAHDDKSFKARSAGAMLRRHGEQMMRESVAKTLEDFDFTSCDRIFLAVPERARRLFIFHEKKRIEQSEKRFLKSDPRLRRVTFMTQRPTLDECNRVFAILETIEFSPFKAGLFQMPGDANSSSVIESDRTPQVEITKEKAHRKVSVVEQPDKLSNMGFFDRALHIAVTNGSLEDVERELEAHSQDLNSLNQRGETPTHIACALGNLDIISLLLSSYPDLAVKDLLGHVPFQRAKDSKVRDILRSHRMKVEADAGDEDHTDWSLTLIPEPPREKSEEELQAKRDKEREKRKRLQERKRQEKQEREDREKQEKERLEEEKKQAVLLGSCKSCFKPLPTRKKDWFTQGDKNFCSSECLRAHTRKVAADAAERRFANTATT